MADTTFQKCEPKYWQYVYMSVAERRAEGVLNNLLLKLAMFSSLVIWFHVCKNAFNNRTSFWIQGKFNQWNSYIYIYIHIYRNCCNCRNIHSSISLSSELSVLVSCMAGKERKRKLLSPPNCSGICVSRRKKQCVNKWILLANSNKF